MSIASLVNLNAFFFLEKHKTSIIYKTSDRHLSLSVCDRGGGRSDLGAGVGVIQSVQKD